VHSFANPPMIATATFIMVSLQLSSCWSINNIYDLVIIYNFANFLEYMNVYSLFGVEFYTRSLDFTIQSSDTQLLNRINNFGLNFASLSEEGWLKFHCDGRECSSVVHLWLFWGFFEVFLLDFTIFCFISKLNT
jgi:hypothetical protein